MGAILAVDATPLFDFHKSLSDKKLSRQAAIDYRMLDEALVQANRGTFGQKIAFVSINKEHDGQRKFCDFLASVLQFTVDETDYRDAFVTPNRLESVQYQRLSTRITYLAGLLVQRQETPPPLVVVSDAFDLYYPLLDYVQNRGGRVSIAFFRSGMEERWNRVGLFSEESPIRFIDLSDFAESILGVDLSLAPERNQKEGGGLGSIQL